MTDFSDMLSKAKVMQEKMKAAQEQIKKIEVEGIAGGDLVKVILSGDYELKSIIISDIARKESQEIINDLIIAAYNNAKENLKKKSEHISGEVIPTMMSEMGLSFLKLSDGSSLEVKTNYSATITQANKDKAFNCLLENNLGDLIKNNISVSF